MKVLHSVSQNTYNIIHDNGVQTSIKVNPSGCFDSTHIERDAPILSDKNKYTVIISSSLGCQMSCSFCHLTKLGKKFNPLSSGSIIDNVLEAIGEVYKRDTSIASRYIKLCYMGEGEALLNMSNTIISANAIIDSVMELGYAKGLDGIDIATSMPNVPSKMLEDVVRMNDELTLSKVPLNPHNHSKVGRSVVRLFYSLHHYDQTKRDIIIPNSKSIDKTLALLSIVSGKGVNVVVHYMFMKGVNDDVNSVYSLVDFVNTHKSFLKFEFRVLRYNGFDEGDKESNCMQQIISTLEDELRVGKFKVQFSAGEDVKAACGMFI